jgi:hypothetical protein
MSAITTRAVEYPADGLTMIGHLALPAGVDRRPAVLLGPEGPGLNDFQRRPADALAEHRRLVCLVHLPGPVPAALRQHLCVAGDGGSDGLDSSTSWAADGS